MLSVLLIVFREILEASIVIGIVMAVTRQLPARNRWILGGIGAGLLGSVLLALGTGAIADALEGRGQEVFNGSILLIAVVMIGWTVIWMKRHVKELTGHVRKLGVAVVSGQLPLYTLAAVIATAVLREGAEIVLFTYGLHVAGSITVTEIIAGGAAGVLGGAIMGTLFYYGLLKVSQKYVFSITSWMLILLAAGMAAQGVNFFVAAGLLPEIMAGVWDSSWLISERSIAGKILHAMVGYTERPSAIQLIAYIFTVCLMGTLLYRSDNSKKTLSETPRS